MGPYSRVFRDYKVTSEYALKERLKQQAQSESAAVDKSENISIDKNESIKKID